MKKICLILCTAITALVATAQRNTDVLNYEFQIQLSETTDTIHANARIRLLAIENSNALKFDLSNIKAEGKGMEVQSATLAAGAQTIASAFTHRNDQVIINTPVKKGDTLTAIIQYKGIPADGLIISKNKYGHRTFFADNWPNRAHHWIACVDDPADKAPVSFIVEAPSHFQVVSNGILVEETNLPGNNKRTAWREEVPLPTKVMVIGVADFAVGHAGMVNDCIPVSTWVFPENRTEGFHDFAPARDILSWYIGYIGPYAYKKLANIQSKTIFGGMENAGAIFYYENSVSGKQREEALIAHEIVHQWFGNHATEKSFAHLWLSEGFATYLTHVYLESRYGTDSLQQRMAAERKEVIGFVNHSHRPVVDNTPELMQLLNTNSYQKGGWILHMLRRELGDTTFRKIIRKYYETYAGKNADTPDFRAIAEMISGKNLEQFFAQWLYTPENPKLAIRWKYLEKERTIRLTVTQLQNRVFAFPLEISTGATSSEIKKISITQKTETFLLPVAGKPGSIIPDPNTSLLFEYNLVSE